MIVVYSLQYKSKCTAKDIWVGIASRHSPFALKQILDDRMYMLSGHHIRIARRIFDEEERKYIINEIIFTRDPIREETT